MATARAINIAIGVMGVLGMLAAGASSASGQVHQQPVGSMPAGEPQTPNRVVDPTLRILQRVAARPTPSNGIFAPRGSFDAHGAEVSLRFSGRVPSTTLREFRRMGVQVLGDAFADRGIYRARIPWVALDRVAARPEVVRIEAIWQARNNAPLEVTSTLIDATAARLRTPEGLDGRGVRVGLIDTGIDVLHPAMFRADAGHYAWLDVDDDGDFSAGVDAVDLNHNGRADSNETLRVLDATVIVDFEDGEVENADGELDTNRDWVYADMNGDGVRNAGAGAGFNESTPAYGEAIFVVDDADRSGSLDRAEKLVRLGTSKISRYVTAETSYDRGQDLIAATSESTDAFHGTGVAGILVGGQAPYHDRVGVAPGADVFVYGLSATLQRDNDLPLGLLEVARADEVDLLVHEWTNSFTQPLDGSTNFEAAMNAARDDGMIHINPVGNLNQSQKHTIVEARPGTPASFAFSVGEGFEGRSETFPYTSAFGSLQWREAHPALAIEVTAPSGDSQRWRIDDAQSLEIAGATVDLAFGETPRGTGYLEVYVQSVEPSTALQKGDWTIELSGFATADEIWGRITDEYSNWRPGIRWVEPVTGRGTVAFPSTADSGFGVGAYAGRGALGSTNDASEHRLRMFSGRGPRVDGRSVVALTAPDDPFVPLAATPEILDAGWGRSWFTAFGGTSGAAPHVGGTVALMRALEPEATPDEIEQRLIDSARAGDLVPEPDTLPGAGWGYGRLDAYQALFGEPAPVLGAAPVASLRLDVGPRQVVFDGSDSTSDGPLEYRFDLDYDGVWDTDWSDAATFVAPRLQFDEDQIWARLQVRDTPGQRSGAVARWTPDGGAGADATDTGGDVASDAGSDVGTEPPGDGGCCSHTDGRVPVQWGWVVVLLGVCWSRRRAGRMEESRG